MKRKSRGKRLPVVLDRAEVEAVMSKPNTGCPTGLRNRCILELMYQAGFRNSEITALKPTHIRWNDRRIEVHDGKGGRDRVIPIDKDMLGWLRAWDAKRPKKARCFFSTLKGKRISARQLQLTVKRYAVKALGEDRGRQVTPHTLRHTFATELLDDGFSIREVQELLGHSNVSTTMIYTHVNHKEIAAKIQRRHNGDERDKPDDSIMKLAEILAGLTDEQKDALKKVL